MQKTASSSLIEYDDDERIQKETEELFLYTHSPLRKFKFELSCIWQHKFTTIKQLGSFEGQIDINLINSQFICALLTSRRKQTINFCSVNEHDRSLKTLYNYLKTQ